MTDPSRMFPKWPWSLNIKNIYSSAIRQTHLSTRTLWAEWPLPEKDWSMEEPNGRWPATYILFWYFFNHWTFVLLNFCLLNIINQRVPTMDTIFISRCLQKTHNILKDSFHPANYLFELLPSGKCYRSIRTRTTRFMSKLSPYHRVLTALISDIHT